MSKELEDKINELFENTKDLMSFEEIKPYCDAFNEYIKTTNYARSTLGSKFSEYGFYKNFRSIKLIEGKNAKRVPKHDIEGNPTNATILKHYVDLLCGLTKHEWSNRNNNKKVVDRIDSNDSFEIDPNKYLELTAKLLASDEIHEIAVGILASTGRRPSEMVARGVFEVHPEKEYFLIFKGQLKKRGETPTFEIPTLHPANYVLKKFTQVRSHKIYQTWLKTTEEMFPDNVLKQNKKLDSLSNKTINRIIQKYYDLTKTNKGVLQPRKGEIYVNSTALRAAYSVLATERDCDGSIGSKLQYAGKILGHIIDPKTDQANIKTTIGYTDYKVMGKTPFAKIKSDDEIAQLRAFAGDVRELKSIQKQLELDTQPDTISRLIENFKKSEQTSKELKEAKKRIAELENMLKSSESQFEKTESQYVTKEDFEQLKQLLLERNEVKPSKVTNTQEKESVETDWSQISNKELWERRYHGGSVEKVKRSFEMICEYNNYAQANNYMKMAITNQVLRYISKVNGEVISEWLNDNKELLLNHHKQHGMLNSKEPDSLQTYYNKGKDWKRIANYIIKEGLKLQLKEI